MILAEIRAGAYADSVVLLRLQRDLGGLPGIRDAAALMGTSANRELLRASGLWTGEAERAGPEDLLIVVRAEKEELGLEALGRVDELMRQRSGSGAGYRPRSLETALRQLPGARFVAISIPGRYAAAEARRALEAGLHVFLFSDNVALDDEIALKQRAAERGLLMMGPDCGTALVGGAGFGFANRVRRGPLGLIGASGTGLQTVASRIHALGGGVSHALGTGGRDLAPEVGGASTRQALQLLGRDPDTRVLAVISKAPAAEAVTRLLRDALQIPKSVVLALAGYSPPARRLGHLHFALDLEEAAGIALRLEPESAVAAEGPEAGTEPGYLRGLFAGGTLAREALGIARALLQDVRSNLDAPPEPDGEQDGHWIFDLGADEFTEGRLHPMIDQQWRIRRLLQEAEDPRVDVLLLDVVLGDGAHPDPAAELAPAIEAALGRARKSGRRLRVVAAVVGTEEDPQGLGGQLSRLRKAGAVVFTSPVEAAFEAVACLPELAASNASGREVDAAVLQRSPAVLNLGLESIGEALQAGGAQVLQLDWRPPAGGDRQLMEILSRMK